MLFANNAFGQISRISTHFLTSLEKSVLSVLVPGLELTALNRGQSSIGILPVVRVGGPRRQAGAYATVAMVPEDKRPVRHILHATAVSIARRAHTEQPRASARLQPWERHAQRNRPERASESKSIRSLNEIDH